MIDQIKITVLWLAFFLAFLLWQDQVKDKKFDYQSGSYPIVKIWTKEGGHATGFLISPNGYIVTCNHVVEEEEEVLSFKRSRQKAFWFFGKKKKPEEKKDVPAFPTPPQYPKEEPKLQEEPQLTREYKTNVLTAELYGAPGSKIPMTIVWHNRVFDIALLKIDNHGVQLPYLKLSKREPEIGEDLYLIGNPWVFSWAGYETKLTSRMFLVDDNYYFALRDTVAPGISGAPVVNQDREVVCITNAILIEPTSKVKSNICIPIEPIFWMSKTLHLDIP